MANLRGGSVEKQLKDAFHRLEAFGKGRHGQSDHLTHSDGTATKREMYLRDFGAFVKEEAITEKVNQAMTPQNIDRFLERRLDGLSNKTKESYMRGWSGVVQGLNEKNISTQVDRDYFDQKMDHLRDQGDWRAEPKRGQAVSEADAVIERLYDRRFATGVYVQTLHEMGYRSSECIRLLKEPDRYIVQRDGSLFVEGLVGKANHVYGPKEISAELVSKIERIDRMPSSSTLYRDLKTEGVNAHGFRYGYAKSSLEMKLREAKSYHDSLKEVSKELNHHREDVTTGYVNRA